MVSENKLNDLNLIIILVFSTNVECNCPQNLIIILFMKVSNIY